MRKIAKSHWCGCINKNKIIDNNVMSKPNIIDADYLGVRICLNPGNVVYACRYYSTIIYTFAEAQNSKPSRLVIRLSMRGIKFLLSFV